MANSVYEYVKTFERPDPILPNTWIVVRVDGRGFHKLSGKYGFDKPNDCLALALMNAAAEGVMKEVQEVVVAYGQSDEYSFVFHPSTTLFERRESKITTTVTSTFTSYYTHLWPTVFPDKPLSPPLPSFDGRSVVYPSVQNLRDYLTWRQVDCHINNTYNTTFWALVNGGGLTTRDAEAELKGTLFKDKNEILFQRFGINYNNEPAMFKKGSVMYRDYSGILAASSSHSSTGILTASASSTTETEDPTTQQPKPAEGALQVYCSSKRQEDKARKLRAKVQITVAHLDIIKDGFWEERPWILGGYVPKGR